MLDCLKLQLGIWEPYLQTKIACISITKAHLYDQSTKQVCTTQVLLLSQEFNLDELVSLEYILEAYDQVKLLFGACSGVAFTSINNRWHMPNLSRVMPGRRCER